MDRPMVEPDASVLIEPGQRVLEPILIIPLWKILARMRAATLRSADR
jgi:hypothetical protein